VGKKKKTTQTLILLNLIIQAMMGSQNTTQQKDSVRSGKLFFKNLKAAKKSISSLGIKNIII